jgi:FkbM family methyltransferase
MNSDPQSEPLILKVASSIVRRLPVGRYRMMNFLTNLTDWPVFAAPGLAENTGCQFVFDLRDSIARELYFMGSYEPQETSLVRATLREGMTFLDVGAHFGYFTALAARIVGNRGRVISLEPDPRLFAKLKWIADRNQLSQVTPIQIAAAESAGMLKLEGYDESAGNYGLSKLVNGDAAGSYIFDVRAGSIDQILDDLGVNLVDLVKMDIEGAEQLAIRGMSKGLSAHRYRNIIIELHPRTLEQRGVSVRDVLVLLEQNGYRGWRIDHSPRKNREASYSQNNSPASLISDAYNGEQIKDDWPHMLWLAPGVELPA